MSGNLLAQALANLPKQTVQWYQYKGSVTQGNGLDVPSFATAQSVQGSWQPIPRKDYEALGLTLEKSYVFFYTVAPIQMTSRGYAGDEVSYQGQRYKAVGADGWQNVYQWDGIMLEYMGPG